MAKSMDSERAAIAAEETKLNARKEKLAEREREAAMQEVEKSGLLKLDPARLSGIVERIRKLGIAELEKRLAA